MIDPVAVIRTHLLSFMGAQVGTRVFGLQLPTQEVAAMPRKCVVLVVDGMPAVSLVPRLDIRATFHCYGASNVEAYEVARALHDGLKRGGSAMIGATFFYAADVMDSGSFVLEPETKWPRFVCLYSFVFSEA